MPDQSSVEVGCVVQYPCGARSSACIVNMPPRPPRLVPVKSFAFPSGALTKCQPSANEPTMQQSSCRSLRWPKKAQRRQLQGSFGLIDEEFLSGVL